MSARLLGRPSNAAHLGLVVDEHRAALQPVHRRRDRTRAARRGRSRSRSSGPGSPASSSACTIARREHRREAGPQRLVHVAAVGLEIFVQVDREREPAVAVGREHRARFGRGAAAREAAVDVAAFGVAARPGRVAARVQARPDAVREAAVEQPVAHERQQRPRRGGLVAVDARRERDGRRGGVAEFGDEQRARRADARDLAHAHAAPAQLPPGGRQLGIRRRHCPWLRPTASR